ncbi:MAG: right-handed parallel beta-helix repeat-containing protein [Bryobacteraceae bacterium]|nr:right-handed parallel beta-helix repeat-containing protein [Bryobacteraceae bacterium]
MNHCRLLLVPLALCSALSADEPGDDWVLIPVGANIQEAVTLHPENTKFRIQAGTHRLQRVRPKNGQQFVGEPGAVLNGADVLTGWSQEGRYWVLDNQNRRGDPHGQCQPDRPRCANVEEVFVNDEVLEHVASLDLVGPGKWYFDYANRRIYIGQNPEGQLVELASQRWAFYGSAANIRIADLRIEKYANPAQVGVVHARLNSEVSKGWILENCVIRLNHGSGVRLGHGMRLYRNKIHHNGQLGIGDAGDDVIVEDNDIFSNNFARFEPGWEGGGTKFVFTNRLEFRYNRVFDNFGTGVWTDIDNDKSLIEFNDVYENWGPGIQHEISYSAIIRYNSVRRNARGGDPWVWGSQILVQNSQNVEVHDNYVEVAENRGDGIFIVQQNRGAGRLGPYVTINNHIYRNEIVFLGAAGTTGAAADYNEDGMFNGGNRFSQNGYRVQRTDSRRWEWRGLRTWEEFQRAGADVDGWAVGHAEQKASQPSRK